MRPVPVIDTSVLVPLFDADHPLRSKAQGLTKAPGVLAVCGGVLAELTTVIRRRGKDVGLDGDQIAREALAHLEALRGFRHIDAYDARAVSQLYREVPGLSYVDAWGVVIAIEMDEELLTFDTRQADAYRHARS